MNMTRLRHFVQVFRAYANSFLPDGHVEEKIHYLSNPDGVEGKLEGILRASTIGSLMWECSHGIFHFHLWT
jgi:hypothetical protein